MAVVVSLVLVQMAQAQVGSGWTQQTFSKRLEYETNDILFSISPPPSSFNNGDCEYDNTGGVETFQLLNPHSNRIEIRPNDDYSSGTRQFQAEVLISAPSSGESIHQIFNGSTGPWLIVREESNTDGSIRMGGGTSSGTLASNLYGVWFHFNSINNMTNDQTYIYVNGQMVWQGTNPGGTFYTKYGCYGTLGAASAMIQFKNAKLFSNGNIVVQDFSLSNSPASQTVLPGNSTSYSVSATFTNTVNNIVYYSVSNLPAGASASFSPPSVTGSGSSTLTVTTSSSTPAGAYTLTIIGATSDSSFITHATTATLNVAPLNLGFQISASPSSQTINAGTSTNFTVTVMTNSDFSGTVALGIAGLPTGANANFNPPSLIASGTSTLTINTTTNAPGGSYPLTILGTNGNFALTTTATLAVNGLSANPGTLLWTDGSGTDTNWSTIQNWTNTTAGGHGPPGISNDAVFNNTGATLVSNTTDNIVDSDRSISSLAFANTNSFHTTQIPSGGTLTIAGGKGLTVGTEIDLGTNVTVNASIIGASGSLVISNTSANLLVRQYTAGASGGIQRATLDLSGLNNFTEIGNSIEVGNYPGTGTARSAGTLYLAQSNTLTLYTQVKSSTTNAGIDVADNPSANSSQSSFLFLGQQNKIYTDGITVGGGRNIGWMGFNPNFQNSTVFIRGTNGDTSRVSRWLVGDNSSVNNTGSNSRGTNDFTGGTVDALVNTMILGHGESPTMSTGNSTGVVMFASGTIDVNNLQLGAQVIGATAGTGTSIGTNYVGEMDVNGTGTLVVNSNLTLAIFSNSPATVLGILNINGGTVEATNIVGGGGFSTINLNSGMLDLKGSGQIANVSILNVGANGMNGSALLQNAADIFVSNAIVVAANGTIAGNTFVVSPGLTVNGIISPGNNYAGAMTNNGPVTLGASGDFVATIQDATAGPVAGWGFLQVNGGINIQSSSASPFIVMAQTPDGLANFDYHTNYDWVIATASGGITGFAPAKFTVDDTQFASDLAGGYFYIRAIGNSLVLSFTNNHPPVATQVTLLRTGSTMAIPISTLASHWSDPDGDPVMLTNVTASSANGTNNLSTDGNFIYYTNSGAVFDSFTYTIADVRTNPPAIYLPDDTVQTATGVVSIVSQSPSLLNPTTILNGNGLVFGGSGGVPNGIYYILASTNVALPIVSWKVIVTNVFDASGDFNFTNVMNPNQPGQFYLLQIP